MTHKRDEPRKPYVVQVWKDVWEEGHSAGVSDYLIETLMKNRETLRRYRCNVEITWGQLPENGRAPWMIPAIAKTIKHLDGRFPLALYFFDRSGNALEQFQCSIGDARVVQVGDERVLEHDQEKVADHLTKVWIPALAKVIKMAGLGQMEFDECYQSAMAYFAAGPRL